LIELFPVKLEYSNNFLEIIRGINEG